MRSLAITDLGFGPSPASVVLALGSNLGDRINLLRRAVHQISGFVRVVRVSSLYRTDPVGCEPGAPDFLNLVIAGATKLSAWQVLQRSLDIERRLGRVSLRSEVCESRPIDIDLILYSSHLIRHRSLQVPHPRFHLREFVMSPLRELELPWIDPLSMIELKKIRGSGRVERAGSLY